MSEWIAHLQNHGPDVVGYGRDDQHPFHGDDDQVDLVHREADGDCNLGGGTHCDIDSGTVACQK